VLEKAREYGKAVKASLGMEEEKSIRSKKSEVKSQK
jgi:hypothetical protein